MRHIPPQVSHLQVSQVLKGKILRYIYIGTCNFCCSCTVLGYNYTTHITPHYHRINLAPRHHIHAYIELLHHHHHLRAKQKMHTEYYVYTYWYNFALGILASENISMYVIVPTKLEIPLPVHDDDTQSTLQLHIGLPTPRKLKSLWYDEPQMLNGKMNFKTSRDAYTWIGTVWIEVIWHAIHILWWLTSRDVIKSILDFREIFLVAHSKLIWHIIKLSPILKENYTLTMFLVNSQQLLMFNVLNNLFMRATVYGARQMFSLFMI